MENEEGEREKKSSVCIQVLVIVQAPQDEWILLPKELRVCKNRGRLKDWKEGGGRGGEARVKAEERRHVHWCFMVQEENLCVIVRTGILWCSLIYCECRVRGSARNRLKGSVNRRRGEGWSDKVGGEKGRVAVIEWAEEGREKRAMAFTEAKYLKRRERQRGWARACGWNQNTQTTSSIQAESKAFNHLATFKNIF